jgi:acetate kinase
VRVLVLNAGSSSLKGSLVESAGLLTLSRQEVALGVDADATITTRLDQAVDEMVARLLADGSPDAVGHRVVHGGARFREPTLVDPEVLNAIEALREFAPLHNRIAAQAIRAAQRAIPERPQVAAFDTAFHNTLDEAAYRYPVPTRWFEDWQIRRYGFHGLSCTWALARTAELLYQSPADLNLVIAHLGSGCSATAVSQGRSVSTSMGLTPLEGLMMATRAGSIDPGILIYLLRSGRLEAAGLEQQLDHQAGLLAVGGSADMRELERRARAGDESARLAIEMFVRRAASGIAAAATALPRLDALVFTGGIGEHAAEIRRTIVARLQVFGLEPIDAIPIAEDTILSAPDAAVKVLRVESREDLTIAQQVAGLLEVV